MKILTLTSVFVPAQNTHMIVGLGTDNKTYVWNPKTGDWIPNWDSQQVELTKLRKKVLAKKPAAKKKAVKKKATKKKK